MKKRVLLLLAACAVLFPAAPVCALTPGTCADWKGKWALTYDNASKNDNVTITDICSKAKGTDPTPSCMPGPDNNLRDAWLCVAKGERARDNQTIQFRRISYDPSGNFAYYEATDAEILDGGPSHPYDIIAADNFTKCELIASGANFGLASGEKDNCTDNGTTPVGDNCTLKKIIPGKISRISAILSPIAPFVIIGSGDPEFAPKAKAVFDTDAIKPLFQLRISTKTIIAMCMVRPFKLTPGVTIDVSVGDCFGTITVK
jgi:hypothetical protein